MQTLVERGCGLDVHQASVVACLLMVSPRGKVRKQMRIFGTTTRELLSVGVDHDRGAHACLSRGQRRKNFIAKE
jgi:hypothetical protein